MWWYYFALLVLLLLEMCSPSFPVEMHVAEFFKGFFVFWESLYIGNMIL